MEVNMPAKPARQVLSIDRVAKTAVLQYPHGSFSLDIRQMDKNQLIKVGTFLKVTWNGTPMHKSLDEIKAIVNSAVDGSPMPTPAPKPAPIPTVPTVATSIKATAPNGSSLDAVIANMVQTILATMPLGTDKDAVLEIANDVMSENLADIKAEMIEVRDAIRLVRPVVTEVHLPHGEVRRLEGVQHAQFPSVLKILQKKRNIFMVGSAGKPVAWISLHSRSIHSHLSPTLSDSRPLMAFISERSFVSVSKMAVSSSWMRLTTLIRTSWVR
jgi:hypothetical protein